MHSFTLIGWLQDIESLYTLYPPIRYLHCIFFFKVSYLFLFYVHWCFACLHVCVRVSDALEVELQTTVSYHVGAGK